MGPLEGADACLLKLYHFFLRTIELSLPSLPNFETPSSLRIALLPYLPSQRIALVSQPHDYPPSSYSAHLMPH